MKSRRHSKILEFAYIVQCYFYNDKCIYHYKNDKNYYTSIYWQDKEDKKH